MKMGKKRNSRKLSESKIELKLQGTEILDKEVKGFGTGGHIVIPREHVGKRVKIIISEKDE
jgi:putative transposon-encoded protein